MATNAAVARDVGIGHNVAMRAVTLALGVALVGPGLWPVVAHPPVVDDGARDIVVKALERARWYEAQHFETRYRSLMTREVRRFDGDGEIEEEGFGDFEVIPIDGAPYERRLTLDGRPLSEQEQVWEQEREAEFREELRRAREAPADEEDDVEDDAIVFNEELIGRFVFTLEPEESLRHRPSFVVSFQPRPGKLPVRRRIDHALNKARGRVWIDRETYEAARVEFELIDKVRLWWGVVGTIARARGSLDRGPVVENMWARLQLETYTDVRVLFSRTRRAEVRRWSDFELIGR